jgi:peptide/nickel transport system substrate-binding protein
LSWAYNKQINPFPYDPLKAIRTLAEAGWKDTNKDHVLDKEGANFDFTVILIEDGEIEEKALRQIQVDLKKIGISMKTKKTSLEKINHYIVQGEFDAIFINLAGRGDPDISYQFWHSSQEPKGKNLFSYKNIKVNKLLEEARRIHDFDLRKKLYDQFQEEMLNDPPGIFLFWANNMSMVHKRFRGVKMHPNWMSDLNDWYVPKEEQRAG